MKAKLTSTNPPDTRRVERRRKDTINQPNITITLVKREVIRRDPIIMTTMDISMKTATRSTTRTKRSTERKVKNQIKINEHRCQYHFIFISQEVVIIARNGDIRSQKVGIR